VFSTDSTGENITANVDICTRKANKLKAISNFILIEAFLKHLAIKFPNCSSTQFDFCLKNKFNIDGITLKVFISIIAWIESNRGKTLKANNVVPAILNDSVMKILKKIIISLKDLCLVEYEIILTKLKILKLGHLSCETKKLFMKHSTKERMLGSEHDAINSQIHAFFSFSYLSISFSVVTFSAAYIYIYIYI
jgi:hypothetical protein